MSKNPPVNPTFTPRPAGAHPGMPAGIVGVLHDDMDAAEAHARSSDAFGGYALEILAHAGLQAHRLSRADLLAGNLPAFVLLPAPVRLKPAETAALRSHVAAGGALIATGGVEGANELFGITASRRRLAYGTLDWPAGGLGLPARTLPAWGIQVAQAAPGATALGEVRASHDARGVAAVKRIHEQGIAIYLAADIPASVVRLQQGWPVLGDGAPAPDGSAAIDDRLLKTDDGAALDWDDREAGPEGPAFLTPYADCLRELLLAAVLSCAEHLHAPLPLVWYWPDAAPAAATVSFDTDSNEGRDGWRFLEVLDALELKGSWCVMFPGGYPRALYDTLRSQGHEIALHYDALTTDLNGAPHCDWSRAAFEHQHQWLKDETGVPQVVSQKNHVTRWEGWVEFFRWVEQAGILVDQTKGPSKIGNLGFLFGSCHLWRPIEDARHDNRLMDVLELPFLTHDMWTSDRRVALRRRLLDAVRDHHGVAHYIFHPQRIWEEGMPEALGDIVTYAREKGLRWWTSAELAAWEMSRRAMSVRLKQEPDGLVVELANAPQGVTLLLSGLPEALKAEPGVHLDEMPFLGRTLLRLTFDHHPPQRLTLGFAGVEVE